MPKALRSADRTFESAARRCAGAKREDVALAAWGKQTFITSLCSRVHGVYLKGECLHTDT